MKKVIVLVSLLALGGIGFGVRTYLHNQEPAVKAERLANEGRLRDALVELRSASRADPRSAELHVRTGQVQAKLADPVAAEKEFRTALQLGADRAAIAPDLGEAILVQGRFRDVLREVPNRGPTPALAAKNLLLRAVAQLSLNDLPATEATLAEAEARAPEAAETALIGARLAAARNQPELMNRKLSEVLSRDPNQVEALLMQEKALTVAGDRKMALELTDRAVKAAPWSAMARVERASQYLYLNEDRKAQEDVDAVLRSQPRFMDAIYFNAILTARRGQLAEAAAQFEKLDTAAGRIPAGLYFQALIALQSNNLQTAADFARRYNQLVPQDMDGARLLGRMELALNRPAEALPVLLRLASELPKDAEAQDLLGRAYAGVGRLADAGRAFDSSVTMKPDDPQFRFHLGAQQLQSGRTAEALASLDQAFTGDPKIPGLGTTLAEALIARNDLPRAETVLAKTKAGLGDSPELAALQAAVRTRQKDVPAARAILVEAARRFPEATDLRVQLVQLMSDSGQAAEATPILQAILAKEPARMSAVTTMITMQANDNDLPGAIRTLEAARRAAPRDRALAVMLADAQTVNKDPRAAIATLRELGPAAATGGLVGAALARAEVAVGKPEDAIVTYRAMLRENPEDLASRGKLSLLLTERKDYPAVAATIEEALRVLPGNYSLLSGLLGNTLRAEGLDAALRLADVLRAQPSTGRNGALLKGDLLMVANQPARAAEAFRSEYAADPSALLLMKAVDALALSGSDPVAAGMLSDWLRDHPGDPQAAQRLAQLDIVADRYDRAEANLGLVLTKDPENATALNNLAWVYLMRNDERALATAQRAYLREPSALAGDTLGWALVRTGSARAAVPLLQRAASLRPADPSVRYHLAAALAADSRPDEATRVLDALNDAPAFPDQAAARKLAGELRGRR